MIKNIGNIDRIIRFALGGALVVAGAVLAGSGLWWLGIIGLILAGTAFVRVCPLYLPFGINTGKK